MTVYYNNNNKNKIPYHPIVPSPYPSGTSSFQFPTRWTLRQSTSTLFKIKDLSKTVMYRAEEKAVMSWGFIIDFLMQKVANCLAKLKGGCFVSACQNIQFFSMAQV
jgi:hypothetical protein